MLLINNPTAQEFYNPWEGQGSTIDTGGGYSTPDDGPGGFWEWWSRNGDEASDVFNTVMCAIKPEWCGRNSGNPPPVQQRQDNTIMFVLLGIIVLLLIVFIFKK